MNFIRKTSNLRRLSVLVLSIQIFAISTLYLEAQEVFLRRTSGQRRQSTSGYQHASIYNSVFAYPLNWQQFTPQDQETVKQLTPTSLEFMVGIPFLYFIELSYFIPSLVSQTYLRFWKARAPPLAA